MSASHDLSFSFSFGLRWWGSIFYLGVLTTLPYAVLCYAMLCYGVFLLLFIGGGGDGMG